MIHLTRLNNTALTLNCDLIKYVEQNPDTVITLLNGEKILVRESAEQVLDRIIDFRRRLLAGSAAVQLASGNPFSMSDIPSDKDGPRG